jgi:hypothetical protein
VTGRDCRHEAPDNLLGGLGAAAIRFVRRDPLHFALVGEVDLLRESVSKHVRQQPRRTLGPLVSEFHPIMSLSAALPTAAVAAAAAAVAVAAAAAAVVVADGPQSPESQLSTDPLGAQEPGL